MVPETVDVYNYKNIPIGKYARFEKPEPYGRWKGIWDGTVLTRRVRQSTQFDEVIGNGCFITRIKNSTRPINATVALQPKKVKIQNTMLFYLTLEKKRLKEFSK